MRAVFSDAYVSKAILIVEDDPGVAMLERRRLERAGYRVLVAASAEEAWNHITRGDAELVVLDYGLPGGRTGLEVFADWRSNGHDLPVIMVTGQRDEAVIIHALRAGIQDFLTKSHEFLDYLPDAVQRVLTQVQTKHLLAESEQRFRIIFDQAAIGIAHQSLNGVWVLTNAKLQSISGYTAEELANKKIADFTDPGDYAMEVTHLDALTRGESSSYVMEKRLIRKDGSIVWIHVTVTRVPHAVSTTPDIVAVVEDITARKALEAQLTHQAFHDALTELPNRALFMDRLSHAVTRSRRQRSQVAVLFLDLDRFKVVNDSLGHAIGDELLVAVTARLGTCIRAEDTLARLGGDEFTVLLEDVGSVDDVLTVAHRISEALRAPFQLSRCAVVAPASIGIALTTGAVAHADTLLRGADLAMYRAKDAGGARYAVFDTTMGAQAIERLELESDLRQALARGEFVLVYQPNVWLATGAIYGVEALVRWQHPKRGLLGPGAFIALAEETGLIEPIGAWVLTEACRQVHQWHDQHARLSPLMLAVNLSERQFQHAEIVQTVAQILADTGFPPTCLLLELTEGLLIEGGAENLARLNGLKALGCKLALDDFGTGYSSLSYLRRFPIDLLKIDRSFVATLGDEAMDTAIIEAMIGLGKSLHLEVVAEGIETMAQAQQLRLLGCERGQGYLFARPLPWKEVEALLPVSPDIAAPAYPVDEVRPKTAGIPNRYEAHG